MEESKQCFICKSWMDEEQLVEGNDGFLRCYEHAYLNQETLVAALREAGEKMAELLGEDITDDQLTKALDAWKAANK